MFFKSKKTALTPVDFTKDGFPDYLKKEIFMQRTLVSDMINRYVKAGKIDFDFLKIKTDKIRYAYIISDYDSYCVALSGAYNFEVLTDIPCQPEIVSEFNCSNPVLNKHTLVIVLANSEEDCAQAKKRVQENDAQYIGIYDTLKENERAVTINFQEKVSVKTAQPVLQTIALTMLALYIGEKKQLVTELYSKIAVEKLTGLDKKIKNVLLKEYDFKELGVLIKDKQLLFTGSNVDYAVSLYGSYFLKKTAGIEAKAVPLGAFESSYDRKEISVFIASNSDFYSMLGERGVSLTIAPDSLEKYKNVLGFGESIPLLNPVIVMICVQLIGYYSADDERLKDFE